VQLLTFNIKIKVLNPKFSTIFMVWASIGQHVRHDPFSNMHNVLHEITSLWGLL